MKSKNLSGSDKVFIEKVKEQQEITQKLFEEGISLESDFKDLPYH